MQEATLRTVALPEDEPGLFEDILEWIYNSRVKKLTVSISAMKRAIRLYVLADKLCMENLVNQIMDAVKDWHVR